MTAAPFCFYCREGLGELGLEIAAFGCVIGNYCFNCHIQAYLS